MSADATANGTLNYTWVITDASDAKEGLASGRFAAVITIPANFSAAATSFSGPAAAAEQATIDVTMGHKSTVVDNAISQVITETAASVAGNQLTTTYLENVYTGFNSLNAQLGQAASGADSLASGTTSLASGAANLSTGATSLASGAESLSDGVDELSGGLDQLASGLGTLQRQTASLPAQTSQLAAGAQGVATAIDTVNKALADKIAALEGRLALATASTQAVCADGHLPDACASLEAQLTAASSDLASLKAVSALTALGTAADQVAAGAAQLATAMPAVTGGIGQSASAAAQLANAGSSVDTATAQLATGADQVASGAQSVAAGAASVDSGAQSLDSGLASAVTQLPTYTDSESSNLATVVARPVLASDTSGLGVGTSSVPFYATLALWLGGLASLIVLRAVPLRVLGSTRSSLALAVRAWVPIAIVGAVQGLLVTGILSTVLSLDLASWFAFALIAILVGVAFGATNQALVALFGGAGRFVSMVVALVLIGTSIIATAPPALTGLQGILPVQPALDAFQAVVGGGAGGGALVGLVVWTLLALGATTLAVARRRSVSARKLVPAAS